MTRISDEQMDHADDLSKVIRQILDVLRPLTPHMRAAVFQSAVSILEAKDADADEA